MIQCDFSGFFFLIFSVIVEVYLWWKLQASITLLSGRTCTIGGWLNTFLPHCMFTHTNNRMYFLHSLIFTLAHGLHVHAHSLSAQNTKDTVILSWLKSPRNTSHRECVQAILKHIFSIWHIPEHRVKVIWKELKQGRGWRVWELTRVRVSSGLSRQQLKWETAAYLYQFWNHTMYCLKHALMCIHDNAYDSFFLKYVINFSILFQPTNNRKQ
jgi:hypothetical protein